MCKQRTPAGEVYHIAPSPRASRVGDGATPRARPRSRAAPGLVPVGTPGRTAAEAYACVSAAVSAAFLNAHRFQLCGALRGIPYFEACDGVLTRRRLPRVQTLQSLAYLLPCMIHQLIYVKY